MVKKVPNTEIEIVHCNPGKKILLIDDDEDQLFVLGAMLERRGFSVTAVRPNQIEIRDLDPSEFTCIVADVMMPNGGGKEILRKVRILHPTLPVVMMSAGREDLAGELLESGATAFCLKYDHDKSLLNEVVKICTA
jgi:DNA-binding NtrC family response regulator